MIHAIVGIVIYFLIVGVVLWLRWRTVKMERRHHLKRWEEQSKQIARRRVETAKGKIYNLQAFDRINRDITRLDNQE